MANMWQQMRRFWCALFTREVLNFRADRGRRGEEAALCLLKGMGFSLVARNARIGGGEIDLVMKDGEVLVFVEVRARKQGALVSGYHSLTRRKRRAFRRAAVAYLHALPRPCKTHRYDVVEVELPDDKSEPVCRHFANVDL